MHPSTHRYFVLNKPRDMVSQFVSSHNVLLLGAIDFDFPEGIHAIGRLDKDSEGLLLLTTNKKITTLLFQSTVPHKRVYLVQVMNKVSEESLQQLRAGVTILLKEAIPYKTPPCEVEIITNPQTIAPQAEPVPPYIPITWLLITLYEGKFRQVRKMVSAIRHKCKRLIRVSIEDLSLGDLEPGKVREIKEDDFLRLLHL
ncbi:MAG: pseudouridine synthase [Agriterribacter sp.]